MICECCHGQGRYWNGLLSEWRPCPDCMGSGITSCCDAAGSAEPPSFTCPRCGAVSYNPNDIRERYCGRCHVFVDDAPGPVFVCAACGATQVERMIRCEQCGEPLVFPKFAGLPPLPIVNPPAARRRAEEAYRDARFLERACDMCGRLYQGPAVFCSLECAIAAA
jgi:hypothetical protein